MDTFWISAVSFTSKVTSLATLYPYGADSSLSVYFPTGSLSIICVFPASDVQLSTSFPSASITESFAPGNSFLPVISVFEISTLIGAFSNAASNSITFTLSP